MTKLLRNISKTNIVSFAILMAITIAASVFVSIQAGYDAEESTMVSEWFTNITIKIFNVNSLENIRIAGKAMDLDMFQGFIRKFIGHFGIFAFIGLMLNISLVQILERSPSLLIATTYHAGNPHHLAAAAGSLLCEGDRRQHECGEEDTENWKLKAY